ncbi:MAG: electron transport complex subunit RsxE [Myxococcota bacterium]
MKPAASLRDTFQKGLWKENPVFVALLGLCPALAVTNSAINGLALGAATTFVLIGASFLVSSARSLIPRQIRITTFIIIIATFVTVADLVLQAVVPAIHKELGAFIPLIVVNCLILGRQEAFASRKPVRLALADAADMALGFTLALVLIGTIREILGNGSAFGMQVMPASFEPWVIMILPPGGFFTIALLLAFMAHVKTRREARERRAVGEGVEVGR